ncbi:RNA polymerase sigma factor [Piscibacillus halophilus]|nr:RNA polymerase sigma factor [Piscibacillus halophilus]
MDQHSSQAFHLFYERYIDYVYRIVIGVVKNHEQALDLCQDLFLEYYHKAHTYDAERGSVKAWIAVRARSRSLDYIKKRNREIELNQEEHEPTQSHSSPQDIYLKKEENLQLIELLFKLPAQQRNAIVDNYVHALSHKEIASKWNKPIGTVKSSIRYGIQKLRQYYVKEEFEKRGDSHEEDQPFNR